MADDLTGWLNKLYSRQGSAIKLGLERIQPIADQLNIRQFSCPVVIVAGTNGKGSCIHTLANILLAASYRVGSYTSPHLLKFNERVCINGQNSDDAGWIKAFAAIANMDKMNDLSFFEYTTLAALYQLKNEELDIVLLEIGLGGRLDAVNIVDGDYAIITGIDIDHCEYLGDDREQIGREKAGIFRQQQPVIIGDANPPNSVIQTALEKNCNVYRLNREFSYKTDEKHWHWQGPQQQYQQLPKPMLKIQNVATALMALNCLKDDLPVADKFIYDTLKNTKFNGRFHLVDKPKPIIFDVAHNPQAGHWLAQQLQDSPPKGRTLSVLAMLGDKAIGETTQALSNCVEQWYVAGLAPLPRAINAAETYTQLGPQIQKNCYTFDSVAQALSQAMTDCRAGDRIVVWGSFHTVAQAQHWLMQQGWEI